MKKIILSLLVLSTLFVSCGDDCELTDINDIIVGEWVLNGFDIEFLADGTINDPNEVFEIEVGEIKLNDKSYTIEGDSILNINFSNEEPSASSSLPYDIKSYECDEMVISFLFDITMKRK